MAPETDEAPNTAGRFVAGLQHVFQSWRKPFNPILGETWQVCGARPCGCALVPVAACLCPASCWSASAAAQALAINHRLNADMQAHLPDGTSIFLEQILHHPPVSAFQLIGPGTPGSQPLTRGPCGRGYFLAHVTWSWPA